MGSAAQHNVHNICARMSACAYKGRVVPQSHLPPHHDGHLPVAGEPLCCIHLAPICWQWAKSKSLHFPLQNAGIQNQIILVIKKGFCYLCGFAFLKFCCALSVLWLSLCNLLYNSTTIPTIPKSWFCPYCYKYSPFLPFYLCCFPSN